MQCVITGKNYGRRFAWVRVVHDTFHKTNEISPEICLLNSARTRQSMFAAARQLSHDSYTNVLAFTPKRIDVNTCREMRLITSSNLFRNIAFQCNFTTFRMSTMCMNEVLDVTMQWTFREQVPLLVGQVCFSILVPRLAPWCSNGIAPSWFQFITTYHHM